MMLRHGYSTLLTVLLSLSLAGCFGGGSSSKSDVGSGDRSAETAENSDGQQQDASLSLTDAFSVDAGKSFVLIDGGGEIPLEGKVINPDGVAIAETYWRAFDDGFYRIESTASNSDADNVYQLQTERLLAKTVFAYQFVAIDTAGRAAVDTVYVHVGAYPLTVSANLESESVLEGQTFNLNIVLDKPLDQDLTIEYSLENGSAVIGEDVEACSPCEITIPAGETNIDISLATLNDEIDEEDEVFSVSFPGLPESFGITEPVELTIVDSPDLRPILNVARADIVTNEKAGYVDIPLNIIYPEYEDDIYVPGIEVVRVTEADLAIENSAVIGQKPGVETAFEGSATVGEDYYGGSLSAVNLGGEVPYIRIQIIDDIISEVSETIVVTFTDNDFYRVGESNSVTIRIESDDISMMASARNAYCFVQDQAGITCMDNVSREPMEIPVLGEVEKLVGAANYFCAIHLQDQRRRLDCWGRTPSGNQISEDAPNDVVALNDELCLMTDEAILCEHVESSPEEPRYSRRVQGLIGGHNAYCDLGISDEVLIPISCNPSASEEVAALVLEGANKFQGYWDFSNQVTTPVNCAMLENQLVCGEPFVEVFSSLTNPQDFALLNGDGFSGLGCVIDSVEGANGLVCYENREPAAPIELFTVGDVELSNPYMLTTDNQTLMCLAHLNGIACTPSEIAVAR